MSGESLLHYSRYGNIKNVKRILDQIAESKLFFGLEWQPDSFGENERNLSSLSVDYQNKIGQTALMMAAMSRNIETIKALIQAGSNVNIQDKDNWTALSYAAARGDSDSVRILIGAGSSVDLPTNEGNTALMLALFYKNSGVVRTLLKAGASIDIINKDRKSACSMADDDIKKLINTYIAIRENIKTSRELQSDQSTYFSQIPRDLVFLINVQLEDDS